MAVYDSASLPIQSRQIRVNAANLPAPTKAIAANWASVRRVGPHFEITLGQEIAAESRLVAALHVTIEVAQIEQLLNAPSRPNEPPFIETLENYARENSITTFTPRSAAMPTERTVFERASFAFMAQAGHEAEIRFFYFPPGEGYVAMRDKMQEGRLHTLFKPVVTVYMSSALLWYISRTCQELAQ